MIIFDTHAHYDDEKFDEDRDELIKSLPENDVKKAVTIGTNVNTSKISVMLANTYSHMYAAVGIHPSDVDTTDQATYIDELKKLSEDKKVVAIGEIGLDYYWTKENKELQKKFFEEQIELAKELKLPISVHSRDACLDTIELMKACNAKDVTGVIHCYAYSKESARDFLNMGYYIGVGGSSTFKNAVNLREAIEYVPLDRLVVETDCPYLAPVPFRGKRNSSLYLPYIIENLANIKGISPEEMSEITYNNALKLYPRAND